MKLPTLRQVSGLAMIVNTFLPAIVVVTLGLMIWSTVTTIERNACATVGYVNWALNDDKGYSNYKAAAGDAKNETLKALARRFNERPVSAGAPCKDLRTSITRILENEFYGETVGRIQSEMRVIDRKFEKVKKDAQRVIPRFQPIKPPNIPGAYEVISAVNHVLEIMHTALRGLGDALSKLGGGLTEPFETAGENLHEEFQKVSYKWAVASDVLSRFWSDSAELFNKFWWFFAILGLWLVLSYALWVHRRLAVGWALLCNRDAV